MANIWKAQSKVNNKIQRNNHDLSKKSNISLKFGTLYPVFCKKVFPGDSFSIDTAFNLKLMPVIFPVQTKMRAHMHYFYVRNKNLWSGWEDWITGLRTNEETPHPYLSVSDSEIKTSSIHDFLGVPTSAVNRETLYGDLAVLVSGTDYQMFYLSSLPTELDYEIEFLDSFTEGNYVFTNFYGTVPSELNLRDSDFKIRIPHGAITRSGVSSSYAFTFMFCDGQDAPDYYFGFSATDDVSKRKTVTIGGVRYYECSLDLSNIPDDALEFMKRASQNEGFTFFVGGVSSAVLESSIAYKAYYELVSTGSVEYSSMGIPLFSRELHLNALPYRAYESIYNAFYRNTQVDPLIINGRTEYNKFVENMGDGADNFNYHLHQRNYELDFLTSALPSPQQGVAPLVGMTALGDITIEDENGITTAKATVDDDGTITDVVVTSPAASVEHQRVAMSLAQFGMNIQDFRNANAYLRLLETSIRKGYRYIENILGHWGVAPKHNTLDMPEFIGGFSRDVQVSTVVSSADTLGSDGVPLGDYGGYAQLVGGSKSPVRHFCDDHGFIIGILSVVPTPCYSQLLPKQMIAPTSYLDYYFPEFDQIGYQPITYKEVAPIQSYLDSLTDPNKSLEDTFGYQRPNYDLVGDVDEVHGLFRTDFRNYVINRIFDTRPELGHDFISINPSEINQIFVNTNPDDDCIIGEIGFAVHTKRPVSRVVIPGLGH